MAEQRMTGLSWGNKASATAYYGGEVDEVARDDNLRRAGEGYEVMSMFNDGGCLYGDGKRLQRTRLPLRKMTNGVSGDEEDMLGEE